jgi:hypothetical protein
MATDPSAKLVNAPRAWPLFVVGVLVFFLGPVIYIGQFALGQTVMPWHLPILASVGVVLMAASVWRRRSAPRMIGTLVFLLLTGFVWYGLVEGTRTPAYTGPAQVGKSIPAFETTLADGRRFTNQDLGSRPNNGETTVLIFFRGHW